MKSAAKLLLVVLLLLLVLGVSSVVVAFSQPQRQQRQLRYVTATATVTGPIRQQFLPALAGPTQPGSSVSSSSSSSSAAVASWWCCHGTDSSSASSSALQMGGYYVEADEEKDKNIIDRSQTHMIFGSRCLETKFRMSVVPSETKSENENENESIIKTIVGLIPMGGDDDDDDDESHTETGQESSSVLSTEEDGRTLGRLLEVLFGNTNNTNDDDDDDDDETHALIEIGADPLCSIAAAEFMAAAARGNNGNFGNAKKKTSVRVCVRHPDEDRLRILEHARVFFNPRTPSFVDVDTAPLRDDNNSNNNNNNNNNDGNNNNVIDDLLEGLPPSSAAILVTSSEPFAVSLLKTIKERGSSFLPRVVVPTAFKEAHDGFEYRSMGVCVGEENDHQALEFWEVLF